MVSTNAPLTPDAWMLNLFSAKAAREGSTVRRKKRDIERYVGQEEFLCEVRRRGYSVVENAGQYIIFCNTEPIRRIL